MDTDAYEGSYSAAGGASPALHGNGGPGSVYTVSDTNGEYLFLLTAIGVKTCILSYSVYIISNTFVTYDNFPELITKFSHTYIFFFNFRPTMRLYDLVPNRKKMLSKRYVKTSDII